MSQDSFKNKATHSSDLQTSKLLTLFECQAQIKNFKVNLQPELSCRRKTMLLGAMGKSQTQMCEILTYLPEIPQNSIAVRLNERYLRDASRRSLPSHQYLERGFKLST
ncbi:MAG: hypothetical protein KME38_27470 [Spirirestis rafaelensis WJT71-NPBG6]|nr:hypothetical protein [Spirirestis rafaelensis WJT71-NPBG6]